MNIIFNYRSYAILKGRLANVGAKNPGCKALDMLDIDRPTLDWGCLARGMGVPATKVWDIEEFNMQLTRGIADTGPNLIEVMID